MLIAYRKTNGRAHDIRLVEDDHVPIDGDILLDAEALKTRGLAADELPTAALLSDPPSIDELRAAAITKLNMEFEAAAAAIVAPYPPAERLTWSVQESEARAFAANALAATPYIDSLAAARGVPRADLLARVQAKSQAFRVRSAALIGARQKGRDAIEAAANEPEINAARDAASAALKTL